MHCRANTIIRKKNEQNVRLRDVHKVLGSQVLTEMGILQRYITNKKMPALFLERVQSVF